MLRSVYDVCNHFPSIDSSNYVFVQNLPCSMPAALQLSGFTALQTDSAVSDVSIEVIE